MEEDMGNPILDKYLLNGKFENLAREVLDKFNEISKVATLRLSRDSKFSPGLLAAPNDEAYRKLVGISNTLLQELQRLAYEPAVGRVVIHFLDTCEVKVYYICRATPPNGIENLISYRSPLGRLAALETGEEYDLGEEVQHEQFNDQYITKIQHATFNPIKIDSGWDSRKTEYRDSKEKQLKTITSLLKIIQVKGDEDELQEFEKFIAEQIQNTNITDGIRREIIERFSLPDQIFLDSQQDEIFRLPLNYSLILLGPAGSGKTTTLIRRLGQKLDFEIGLTEEEQRLVLNTFGNLETFRISWIMFTPTELLKSYLKEAFNRENVPATDQHITTWTSYSNKLGRSVLKILQTSKFETGFLPDPNARTLAEDFDDLPGLIVEFQKWLIEGYIRELKDALDKSKSFGFFKDSVFANRLHELISKGIDTGRFYIDEIFVQLFTNQKEITYLYKKEKYALDKVIMNGLATQYKKNNKFLDEYSDFLVRLGHGEQYDIDEIEAAETELLDDEEDDKVSGNLKIRNTIKKYRNFIIWLASRPLDVELEKSSSKNIKQYEWFGDRIPSQDDLRTINSSINKLKCIGILYNPLNKFYNSITSRYRKFRKQKQTENCFYNKDAVLRKKISLLELDILIFIKLRIAAELFANIQIAQDKSSFTSSLRPVSDNYKAQIFVDEAPDFSPLQLGCMKLLAHPKINSFFACGDFNQRLTSRGAKNLDTIKIFLPSGILNEKSISIPYRQTKSLHRFSQKILEGTVEAPLEYTLQENRYAIEGFRPVLGEDLKDERISAWIADRIIEIERILDGDIPSTAILVPSEKYVSPVTNSLIEKLSERTSVLVQACHEGQTTGDERAIRVFDIKHIKGLEFEAAFFISLDRLANIYPDLITNYLYVGATRAAQFLGVTCERYFPTHLCDNLKNEFIKSWEL